MSSKPEVKPLAPPCGHLMESASQFSFLEVHFPEDDCLETRYEGADLDELANNRREIWYQHDELKSIKRKALVISKEAQKHGLGSVLTNTYGKSCDDTQDALNLWCRNASARRGLERWINDEYAAKRSDIRKRTIQSVLRAQAKMTDSGLKDPEYNVKVLSRLSEAFSIDSKNFARGIGVADELASKLDENEANEGEDPFIMKKSPDRMKSDGLIAMPGLVGRNTRRLNFPKRNLGLSSSSAEFRHFY